jgi:hypothetical protein
LRFVPRWQTFFSKFFSLVCFFKMAAILFVKSFFVICFPRFHNT